MSVAVKKSDIRKHLIKKSNGSFSIVHKALIAAKKKANSNSDSDFLDLDEVIKQIKEIQDNKSRRKKAS